MACEDFPCCGHGPGECPQTDRNGRPVYRCVDCGRPLRRSATSSICERCMRAAHRRFAETGEMWPDNDC